MADTSAWSRFYRGDVGTDDPVASALETQLSSLGVVTTGMVYLELLRGFTRPGSRSVIESDFAAVPFVEPTRSDYGAAADLSVTCRRAGVQLDTVDALIAQLCIANDLLLLTSDTDFIHAADHIPVNIVA
ncbi:MAG: PIN domain-containing protein [Microthrixaceae bacterium]